MTPGEVTVVLAGAAVLGLVVPWLFMRMLVPALAEGRTAENYRGRTVFLGLGVVWLVWSGSAVAGGVLVGATTDSVLPVLTLAGPLALVCFALGMVDDAFGTSAARGFRGHLGALAKGRLTTGGLKLFGISGASFVAGLVIAQISVGADAPGLALLLALPAGAAVALTSNFVNLTDLRPGRALKTYAVLAVLGVASTTFLLGRVGVAESGPADAGRTVVDAIALLLFVLGPVVAVWRYDLGERGMLGDAGANAMGAVAGLLIVAGLPLFWLLGYTAVMLALNVASERISFSRVIEDNTFLSAIDRLGRTSDERVSTGTEKSSRHADSRPE